MPEDGAFLDPLGTFGLRKLLLFSGYVGIGMVSFGLVLGIINSSREGQKKHVISKVGWLLFGWGIVLLGLALLHHQNINPMQNVAGIALFCVDYWWNSFDVLWRGCKIYDGVAFNN